MLEKEIEHYFKKGVEALGGKCLKFNSSIRGVPDRIVLMQPGVTIFVEFKRPGKKLRVLQEVRKQEFERLGFKCYTVDTMQQAQALLTDIKVQYVL